MHLYRWTMPLLLVMPMLGNAQISSVWGGANTYTVVSTGRGGAVPDSLATWLESDVDEPPAFPGGGEAIARHFAGVAGCDTAAVDRACLKDRKVLVWFIVERDGSVQEAWIDRGGCDALQLRTICAVLQMPAWTAGRHKGKLVRTRVRIPVLYEAP